MAETGDVFVVRFLLDSNAEDMAYVDIEFSDERQAKKAMNAVVGANGALVLIDNGASMPTLIRSSHVVAAYVIDEDDEYEDEEEEEEEEEDTSADAEKASAEKDTASKGGKKTASKKS